MKKILTLFFCLATVSMLSAQDSTSCDIYNEVDGLVVIEMESLTLTEKWEVATRVPNYTGSGYIQWTGNQYFNEIGNGLIRCKVRINNPGYYRFDWRVAVGKGTEMTEHNDSWLKILASNFYAFRGTTSEVKPRPDCVSDPEYGCPEGSTTGGYFKVYGGKVNEFHWRAQTYDNSAHQINAVFDTAGVYEIQIQARSSFQCIDRMILHKFDEVSSALARFSSNPPSGCFDQSTSVKEAAAILPMRLFPNPATQEVTLELIDNQPAQVELFDLHGKRLLFETTRGSTTNIDISAFAKGIYLVRVSNENQVATKRLVIQ
ncbi:MAG: T9SS type A sorting domain-containing protein [Bacteroidota bacterium]